MIASTRKCLEGEEHPDRDAQFRHISDTVMDFIANGVPISIDTKKKELVGEFMNRGQDWHRKHDGPEVLTYDFPNGIPKAVPCGVYDLARNTGFVSVGISGDTAGFSIVVLRAHRGIEGDDPGQDGFGRTLTVYLSKWMFVHGADAALVYVYQLVYLSKWMVVYGADAALVYEQLQNGGADADYRQEVYFRTAEVTTAGAPGTCGAGSRRRPRRSRLRRARRWRRGGTGPRARRCGSSSRCSRSRTRRRRGRGAGRG